MHAHAHNHHPTVPNPQQNPTQQARCARTTGTRLSSRRPSASAGARSSPASTCTGEGSCLGVLCVLWGVLCVLCCVLCVLVFFSQNPSPFTHTQKKPTLSALPTASRCSSRAAATSSPRRRPSASTGPTTRSTRPRTRSASSCRSCRPRCEGAAPFFSSRVLLFEGAVPVLCCYARFPPP